MNRKKITEESLDLIVDNNKEAVESCEEKIQAAYKGYIYRKKNADAINNEIKKKKLSQKKLDSFDELFGGPLDFEEGWKQYYNTKEDQKNALLIYDKINSNIYKLKNCELIKSDDYFTTFNGIDCIYFGEMNQDKIFNGYGKLYLGDDKKVEGIFVDGAINGWGRYIDTHQENENNMALLYEGFFENNIINGKGKIIAFEYPKNLEPTDLDLSKINKIIYTGEIKNFRRDGYGIEDTNEFVYKGSFECDQKSGYGRLAYKKTSDEYEGEFKNNVINGEGFYKWENGHTFKGTFENGEMHGKGLYQWPDGSSYEGDYIHNNKTGKGKFVWKDGRVYEGDFIDGKPHGKGLLTIKGVTIEANFENGHFIGNLKKEMKMKKSQMNQN